jgi:hypothetical protein
MYDGRVDRRPGRTSACREARCSARGVSRSRSRRPPGPPGGAPSSWRHPPDGGPPTRCAVRRRAVEPLSDERRHRVGVRPGPVGRPPVRTVGVAWPDGLFLWRRLLFFERELLSRGLLSRGLLLVRARSDTVPLERDLLDLAECLGFFLRFVSGTLGRTRRHTSTCPAEPSGGAPPSARGRGDRSGCPADWQAGQSPQ